MVNYNRMYSKLPNLVVGFHGCDEETFNDVIVNGNQLKPSNNKYDWLGSGIYFWEQNYERALEWAKQNRKKNPKVIGAIIDLGNCLNLVDSYYNNLLTESYNILKQNYDSINQPMPENIKSSEKDMDRVVRNLDCAVIQHIHSLNIETETEPFDSVRAVFIEGDEAYPGAGFSKKTHMQICVRNLNSIKGYFNPIAPNDEYTIP